MLFFCSRIGKVIGCGLVISIEFNQYEIFWHDEIISGKVLYPLRYRMKVLWLDNSVIKNPENPNKWQGFTVKDLLLTGYTMTGLQRITKEEVKKIIIEKLPGLVKEYLTHEKELLEKVSKARLTKAIEEPRRLEKVEWNPKYVCDLLMKNNIFVDYEVILDAISTLKAGKHLLLVGPPGTGKTTLAVALAEAHNIPYILCTATAAWTRTHIIGGPLFIGSRVIWRSGKLLEAICKAYESKKGAILIIDEINRANVDKVFGEFLTIFNSSETERWLLPVTIINEIKEYALKEALDENARKILELYDKYGTEDGLRVPENLRILGTMNTFDRRYLFSLGYAFLRRFNVVWVSNPPEELMEKAILAKTQVTDEMLLKEFQKVRKIVKDALNMDLGIALYIDLLKFAKEYMVLSGKKAEESIEEAFISVIIPQLEGIPLEKLKKLNNTLKEKGYIKAAQVLSEYFPEITMSTSL